jgi:hypothetical protein
VFSSGGVEGSSRSSGEGVWVERMRLVNRRVRK